MRFLFILALVVSSAWAAEDFVGTWIAPASKEYPEFKLLLKKNGSGQVTINSSGVDAKWSTTDGGIMLTVLGTPRKLKYDPANDTLSETNINRVYLRESAVRAAKQKPDIDQRLVGSWSNQNKDKSKLTLLSFKSDGNGTLSSDGQDYDFRWSRSAGGIKIYIFDSGGQLNYEAANDTLVDPDQEEGSRVYWRISASARASLKKSIEAEANPAEPAEPQPQTTTQKFNSIEQLRAALIRKLDASGSSLSFISIGKPAREFTVRKLARFCFIELHLVAKSVSKPTPNATGLSAALSSEPDLPVIYSVPAAQTEALRLWLQQNKFEFSELASKTEANGRIESYERRIIVNCHTDSKRAQQVVEFLLTQTFKAAGKPFLLDEMVRE